MASTRFINDRGLTARMTLVMFLLGGLFVALVVALMFVFRNTGLWVLIGFAGIGVAWFQWYNSDTVALKAMRAREVTPQEAPELHGMIDRLCALADMPKPRVAIADTDVPNAFATGRNQKRAVVAVTTGLWDRLDEREIEGVLAHELTHIANRDVLVMTIASFFATLAALLTRWGLYAGMFGGFGGGRDNNNNSVPVWLIVIAVSFVTYILSWVLIRTISRYREYAADRGSALITGAPEYLMSALQKISSQMTLIPQQDLREVEGMSAFFIIPPRVKGSISELFMDHPPLEKRLAALEQIAREMGRPVQ
jgi:heat shock protein HtpX